MNVLSLFDGISCGQIALERAGINVNKYYAAELDKYAITVTQANYPDTIQLGDVTKWREWSIDWSNIELLIGGSPCQGFSFSGKQLAFDDPRSKLFFVYVDILNHIRKHNPSVKFLLENVKMKKEYQNVISQCLGVDPVEINSSSFSVQNRKRLYWTNINIAKVDEAEDCFNGYLYRLGHGYIKDEIKFFKKYPALVAQSPATKYRIVLDLQKATVALNSNNLNLLRGDGAVTRSATPEECEKFQTLPNGYTSILKKGQRYKCIGNGWTVDVIAHIFKGLLDENL